MKEIDNPFTQYYYNSQSIFYKYVNLNTLKLMKIRLAYNSDMTINS